MYCLDADTIINVELAGWFEKLHESAKDGHICFVEGVYRQLTDTSTRIGTKIKNWDKYGCLHKLTTVEQTQMKQLDTRYGPPFSVVNQRNGTLFEPNTLAQSGGINKLPEALIVVSATINCLYLHLLSTLQDLLSPAI